MPVYLVTTRYAIAGSIRSHTNAIRAALGSVGVDSEIVQLKFFGNWPVGGAVMPTVRMLLRGHPAGRFFHAVDVESCFRGTGVVTVHDPLIGWEQGSRIKEFPYRWQMATALRRAHRIVGVSSETATRIRAVFPQYGEKVRYIPPPFDTRVGEIVSKERDLIWVGRNDPSKGMTTLLEVLGDPRLAEMTALVKWTPQSKWPGAFRAISSPAEAAATGGVHRPSGRLRPAPGLGRGIALHRLHFPGRRVQAVTMEAYIHRTRLVLPRIATYTDVYGPAIVGVHWYEPENRDELVRAIQEATSAPPGFTPDAPTLEQVSYRTVGSALRKAYLEAGWRES